MSELSAIDDATFANTGGRRTWRAIVLLLALGAGCGEHEGGPAPGDDTPTDQACATDLEPALARLQVPGLSAAIVKDGAVACTATAGLASIEEDRPVTRDTVFAWASVSKTVTGVTLMTLFDEGRFELDGDVDAHLPFAVDVPGCPAEPVTARQLLTHASSIIDDEAVYQGTYVEGDSPTALGDFLAGYLTEGGPTYDAAANFLPTCPGGEYAYSNIGAGLIGFLAESIAGVPFDELSRARVFDPLAMDATSWRLADLDPAALAMPYDGSPGAFVPHGHIGFATYPDGLLRAPATDLARFVLMAMGSGAFGDARVLEAGTADEMLRVQDPGRDDTQGLIWYHEDLAGRTGLVGHTGGDPGTSSIVFFDPADGSAVLLVANGEWDEDEADALFTTLFAEAATH